MQRQVARTALPDMALERKTEEAVEVYVCRKCGAAHKLLFELIEDELEHVTPDFES